MITHIRMKNFKSWADSGEVKLAPLTGFFGTNSSGKSSLLQMLLLLKQTTECEDTQQVIFFGDETSYANLGDFCEVIHGHNVEELLELEFGCKLTDMETVKIPQLGLQNHAVPLDSFNFETAIQRYGSSQDVSCICYDIGGNGINKIKLENSEIFYRNKRLCNGIYKNCYSMEDTTQAFPGSNDFLNLLSSKFEEVFSRIYYLGPIRVHPQRNYHWEGRHPKHLGHWGNYTIDALLSARVRNLKTAHETEDVPIEQKVSYWLQEMDLAHSFLLNWVEAQGSATYEVRIQKTSNSPPVTLIDMGYGLTQFLPVLVLCYYAPVGSTLILEQPGIHLHPKVQSQIADLLTEVVNERNLQILVESHSEHFLTRLQRRIAEEKIGANQAALYFCRNDEGVSNIEHLEMDEFGNIKNWPENFFGNVMGDMFAMTDKQVERIAENGSEG